MSLIDDEAPVVPAFLDRRLTLGEREQAWQELKATLAPDDLPAHIPAAQPPEEW